MKNSVRMIIITIVLILGGLGLIIAGLFPAPTLVDVETVSVNDLSNDNAYYVEDLAVVYEYGSMSGDDSDNGSYYLAFFEDAQGNYCTVSLYFDNNKELKKEATSHDFDSEDLYVDGCFSVKKISSLDSDLSRYYKECYNELKDRYFGNVPTTDTGLHFRYVCNEKSEYESAVKPTLVLCIAGAAMLLLGGFCFFRFKKMKEEEKAAEQAAQAQRIFFDPGNFVANDSQSSDPVNHNNYNGPEF